MLKLIRYLKGYWAASISAPLFKFMEALFELIIPLVVANIIDVGVANGDTAHIVRMGLLMFGLGAAGFGFSALCQYLAARSSLGYGTNLRRALYDHVNRFSFAELDRFGSPTLVTRITADVNQTQQAVAMFIRLVMRAPFILIGSIVMALLINVKLSLIFIGAAVVVSIILFIVIRLSVPYYHRLQKGLDRVSLLTQENLSGARVVRAFSKEEEEKEDFAAATDALQKTSERVGRISALLNPLTYIAINAAIILLLWLGGKTVYYGDLTQGEIIALVNYLLQIQLVLVVIANLIVTFTKASASAARINEVFDVETSMTEGAGATPDESAPAVRFDDVSFAYGSDVENSLENISFTLGRGQSLGIIGGTGSGKTTLVSLIPRFYDAKGVVEVFGNDVKAYTFRELRGRVAVVQQGSALFSGTLRDNMRMGNEEATDEEIWAALETAQAAEFVRKYPEGLDKVVLAKGRNFSGGQKQRLSIARALVAKPQILILDDASSALDYATDAALRRALKAMDGLTVVSVSQRTNSVMHMDRIIVLEDGRMTACDTHENLLENCPAYAELYRLQNEEAA